MEEKPEINDFDENDEINTEPEKWIGKLCLFSNSEELEIRKSNIALLLKYYPESIDEKYRADCRNYYANCRPVTLEELKPYIVEKEDYGVYWEIYHHIFKKNGIYDMMKMGNKYNEYNKFISISINDWNSFWNKTSVC